MRPPPGANDPSRGGLLALEASSTKSRRQRMSRPPGFRAHPVAGVAIGLLTGLAFCGVVAVRLLFVDRSAASPTGPDLPDVFLAYLGGLDLGAGIAGLLLPIARWRIGAGLIGALAVAPVFVGIGLFEPGPIMGWTPDAVFSTVAGSLLVGGSIGVINWRLALEFSASAEARRKDIH